MSAWCRTNGWFQAWRRNIHMAKTHEDQKEGYSRAAVIAQACYVMALAEEIVYG